MAHELLDRQGFPVHWYGKPFAEAFAEARDARGPPSRLAMVGDTLHTDVLGGAAAGWGRCWSRRMACSPAATFRLHCGSGIRPDAIVATT